MHLYIFLSLLNTDLTKFGDFGKYLLSCCVLVKLRDVLLANHGILNQFIFSRTTTTLLLNHAKNSSLVKFFHIQYMFFSTIENLIAFAILERSL